MENNFNIKFWTSIYNNNLISKLIVKSLLISFVLLINYSTALALDFTYTGTQPSSSSGWYVDTNAPTSANSLHAGDGVATGNNLTITGTGTVDIGVLSNAFGGWSTNSDVIGNTINMSGGTIKNLYGGWSTNGNAIDNILNIEGGSIESDMYGGYSENGNAENNNVNIKGAKYSSDNLKIYGGSSTSGNAENNSVTITGGSFRTVNITGGSSTSGDVLNNSVTITGGSFSETTNIYGGSSTGGNAENNSVSITDTKFNNEDIASITGGSSTSGNSLNNKVTITGGSFRSVNISGGSSIDGNANDNNVVIASGSFTGITNIYGGLSTNGYAQNNSVTITGGSFTGITNIYGGSSTNGGTTIGNMITITGGTFATGTVISGGHLGVTTGTQPTLHNNIVTLNSIDPIGLDLSGTLITGGQHGTDSTTSDIRRTGNRLVVKNKAKVGDVRNFEYYDYYMNKSTDDALLTSTGKIDLGVNAKTFIYLADTTEKIEIGSFIKLININEADLLGSSTGLLGYSTAYQGVSIFYNLTEHYDTVAGIYGMTVTSVDVNPLSVTFPESRLAAFSFMNQANNFILGQGINSAMDAIIADPSQWALFSLLSGVFSGYDTELTDVTGKTSYNGASFMAGIAKGIYVPTGELLTGIYFETGIGFISSKIDTKLGSMNSDGDTNYYGGGILLRYAIDNGFYTEGFFRIGALSHDVISTHKDTQFEYGLTSLYVGAGVNIGYELKLFQSRDMLDIYTNYTWVHLNEASHIINDQDYLFETINSHQLSVGLQYNFIQARMFSPFIGIKAEYEFDAEAAAIIRGELNTLTPNITGFTGIADIGVRITPSYDIPLTMALNFGGHLGRRNGLETSFDIEWRFGGDDQEIINESNRLREEKRLMNEQQEKLNNIEKANKLEEAINNSNIKVTKVDGGISLNIEDFLFEVDSYNLTPEGVESLKVIADEIKKKYPNNIITVNGHTDSTGSLKYNQRLSENRAKTIVDILKGSLDEENLSYEGKAFSEPIANNKTKKGRAKNRRVEIIIEMPDNI